MATTLLQLLDRLTARAADDRPEPLVPAIQDTAGALNHAGRALRVLTLYGLGTDRGTPRELAAERLGSACSNAAGRWPATGGDLTDLMGVAADVVGQSSPLLGRAERWAITVEVAAAADMLAQRAQRLLWTARIVVTPQDAADAGFVELRSHAADVESEAWAHPPAASARAAMDRLIPLWDLQPRMSGTQIAAEATAALVAAISRAEDRGGLTLRELRTVTATAQTTCQYAVAVLAALHRGEPAQPGRSAAAAWQVARDWTRDFDDLQWTPRTEHTDVVDAALLIQAALRKDLGPATAIQSELLSARRDLPEVVTGLQQVANQNPVLADQLTAVIRGWARNGALSTAHTEDMPEDWVRAHLSGNRARAWRTDLDIITAGIGRAGVLSTVLADSLNRTALGPPTQPSLADVYASRVAGPHAGEQLLAAAQQTEHALAATRTPFQTSPALRPDGPSPPR